MRQLVADQRGKVICTRFPAQVSLEVGEMAQRVQFKQGGHSGVGTRRRASQPLSAGAQLQGVQVARIADETLFGAGQRAVIALFAQILFGQLSVSGAAPPRRKRHKAKSILGSARCPKAALARPNS